MKLPNSVVLKLFLVKTFLHKICTYIIFFRGGLSYVWQIWVNSRVKNYFLVVVPPNKQYNSINTYNIHIHTHSNHYNIELASFGSKATGSVVVAVETASKWYTFISIISFIFVSFYMQFSLLSTNNIINQYNSVLFLHR